MKPLLQPESGKDILSMTYEYGNSEQARFELPDECPVCHTGIDVRIFGAYGERREEPIQVVFQCPKEGCHRFFIGYYEERDTEKWLLSRLEPRVSQGREFGDKIRKVSKQFQTIYDQALAAECYGLDEICGAGYRKALEFLVKDYVVSRKPEDKGKIERMGLGACITAYVDNPRIKSVAERGWWLGNDETHYVRKWTGKDITDFKRFIEATVSWILLEILTWESKKDMPGRESQVTNR